MAKQMEMLWQECYKECLHCMDDVILFYDAQGFIMNWNKSAISELGFESEEMRSLSLAKLLKQEDMQRCFPTHTSLIKEEKTISEEMTIYRKNETCFLAEVQILLINKEEIFGCLRIHNKQELVRLQARLEQKEAELQEALHMKENFLANVTHELRTPLNGMKGILSLLIQSSLEREQKEMLGLMDSCCSNMERLINDLLDSMKVCAGKMMLVEEPFPIINIVEKINVLYEKLAKDKGVLYECVYDHRIPSCLIGDAERLHQVITNLLGNAFKFTDKGMVQLEVSMAEERENEIELFVSVTDTGIGFREEEKDKLFVSFSQADASITRKYGGTGLGLAICKEIITGMGGTIDASSKLHKGSKFFFHIPLKKGMMEEKSEIVESKQGSFLNESEITIQRAMEQLLLSIDLGAWDKAENFAHSVKEMTKISEPQISKQAFRVELAIRKNNEEQAKTQFLKLYDMVEEKP